MHYQLAVVEGCTTDTMRSAKDSLGENSLGNDKCPI
jgi:hypothetical protein